MSSVEAGMNYPHAFGIVEIRQENHTGLDSGNYLLTNIKTSDWTKYESNLNSPVRVHLAAWAQAISRDINEPFSLTFKAQTETGFAVFEISAGRVEDRDLYWWDPSKHSTPPVSETMPSVRHIFIDPNSS